VKNCRLSRLKRNHGVGRVFSGTKGKKILNNEERGKGGGFYDKQEGEKKGDI